MAVAASIETESRRLAAELGSEFLLTVPKPIARLRTLPPRQCPALETPQLSVVIVNFCQWNNTARLTHQLRRSEALRRGAAEIVIVDNHSPWQPIAGRLRRLSGVSVVRNRGNHGFARAVNRGSRMSRGEWVLLLNPDVTVPEGFLDQVLDAAQRWPAIDPRAGVIGFQLRHRDGTRQASAGPFPTLLRTVTGLMLPRSRRKCRHHSLSERQSVAWVTGGCLLVRRDCLQELGGLDESYFLYYEDVDLCLRARNAGWSVWYEPALRVTHHFPLHSRSVPAPLRLVTRHALLTYARKHWPRWQARLLSSMVWLEAGLRHYLARWRGKPEAAAIYEELQGLVGDVHHGRIAAAERRIRLAARCLEPVAAAQDGQTQ